MPPNPQSNGSAGEANAAEKPPINTSRRKATWIFFAVIAAILVIALGAAGMRIYNERNLGLYGGWELVSSAPENDPMGFAVQKYIGFSMKGDQGIMRSYENTAPKSVQSILKFTSEGTTTSEGTIKTYSYFDDLSQKKPDDTSFDTYAYTLSGDTLAFSREGNASDTPIVSTYRRIRSAKEEQNLDLTRTPQETADACKTLVDGSEGSTTGSVMNMSMLPITCAFDIGGNAGSASLSIDERGAIEIKKGTSKIFHIASWLDDSGSSDKATAEISDYANGPFVGYPGAISLEDLNYDGYKDIVVLESAGAYNYTYGYFIYNPSTNGYSDTPDVEATNPEVDAKTHTITSNALGRGLGDIYELDTYTLMSGGYVLTREETQDFADQKDYDESKGYTNTVLELHNGKMVVTSKKFRSYKEVWAGWVNGTDGTIN